MAWRVYPADAQEATHSSNALADGGADSHQPEDVQSDETSSPHTQTAQPKRYGHHHKSQANIDLPPLSMRSQRLLWSFIFLYQLINSTLLACLTAMYGTVDTRGTILWFLRYNFLFSQAQTFLSTVHPYVSVGYAILSVIFAYGALTMLWYSIKRRRVCFGPERVAKPQTPSPANSKSKSVLRSALSCIKKLVVVYLSFGLRGRYFTIGFFIRETIESTLQTTQALQSSQSLSNVFVNQSYGVLIFLNCFACIVLPKLYRDNMAKGRLVCVLVDLTLDFAWGTVIPLVMFWPYLRMFYDYQRDAYVPVPTEDVQKEVEFIVVMSLPDFILSTFPFMSSAANMHSIKRLLSNYENELMTNTVSTREGFARSPAARVTVTNVVRVGCIDRVLTENRGIRRWGGRIFQALFLLYGVLILAISVSSRLYTAGSTTSMLFPCLHRVYPWLSRKEACVGRVIDCAVADLDGSIEEITVALDSYDEKTLTNLVFTHCPRLEIPPAIHRFDHLSILTIRDCGVHQWTAEAAVFEQSMHTLQTIRFTNVTFADVPEGLIKYPLPSSLEWLSLADSNIAAFDHLIGDHWKRLKYLYCDNCGYAWFPTIVATMSELLELSLMYNSIPVIEDRDVEQLAQMENFWIDGLPVTSLPDTLWRMCDQFDEFSIQNTSVSSIPDWVSEIASSNLRLYAFGTPLCADESIASKHSFLWCEAKTY